MTTTLYYIHDPMCSWCYAFRPTWSAVQAALPAGVEVNRVLGGLAPDSEAPMPQQMRDFLQDTWRRIEQVVPGTRFNFDFWRDCQPKRNTYRACRAVIAARAQDAEADVAMTEAIQNGYYQQAKNPAEPEMLIGLAEAIGLDRQRFAAALDAPETQRLLEAEIAQARALGADGFPSLVLVQNGMPQRLPLDYNRPEIILDALNRLLVQR